MHFHTCSLQRGEQAYPSRLISSKSGLQCITQLCMNGAYSVCTEYVEGKGDSGSQTQGSKSIDSLRKLLLRNEPRLVYWTAHHMNGL